MKIFKKMYVAIDKLMAIEVNICRSKQSICQKNMRFCIAKDQTIHVYSILTDPSVLLYWFSTTKETYRHRRNMSNTEGKSYKTIL